MNITLLHKTARDAIIGKESVMKSQYLPIGFNCGLFEAIEEQEGNNQLSSTDSIFLFNKKAQTPLMNRIYRNRMIGMEKLKLSILKSLKQLNYCNDDVQFLILGAGYDTSINSNIYKTYCIDFPQVITERRNLCQKFDTHARLIPCDMRDTTTLFHLLESNGFCYENPTIVIAECVLSYIDKISVQSLLSTLSNRLSCSCLVIYDPILVPPCGERLARTFASRNVPLLSAMPSTIEMTLFLRNCSYHHIHSLNIQQFLHSISIPPHLNTPIVEPFDEFAELAALNRSYAFTYCTNSTSLFEQINKNLFIWFESPHLGTENPTLLFRWNSLRCELLNNRLLSYEMKLHPSDFPIMKTVTQVSSQPKKQSPSVVDEMTKPTKKLAKAIIPSPGRHLLSQEERHNNPYGYTLREAKSSDLKNILFLFTESYREYVEKYKSVRSYVKKCSQNIKSSLQSDESKKDNGEMTLFWVAEPPSDTSRLPTPLNNLDRKKGAIVGCVALKLTEKSNIGLLSHLCVREAHRNRGIGYYLTQKILSIAWEKKCTQIELTTLADMESARHLYQTIGFQENNISDIGGGCQLVHMILMKSTL